MMTLLLAGSLFLCGGDVSEIPEVLAGGAKYFVGGKVIDPFVAMKKAGWNFVRFRVWNDPHGEWCDKAHTLAAAKLAHAQGLKISLDFHYSDYWADPGKQNKPKAWKDLPFDALVTALHDYTKDVVSAMVKQGTPPIMVQVGNEITPGMLWPDGRNDSPEGWHRLARLVRAGCEAVKESSPQIDTMIHLDRGGDNKTAVWWFDQLKKEGVDFDLIGLSYYPWWHGSLKALQANLNDLAARYHKDVYVVETSYPWEPESAASPETFKGGKLEPGFAPSPEGQAAFLRRVAEIVREVPEGRGKGLLYWAPTWISEPGRRGGWSSLILFDHEGHALPGFAAMGQ